MNRLATAVHMTLRGSGVLLILLGLAIWTGRADAIIPVHEFLGFVLVLSLWTLAFLAARAGVQRGVVDWHWTIQILHLLVGLAPIGTGEGLARGMRRLGASKVKVA